jgi:ParB family transcriptional regulator, chromosome partitioning protein
VRLAAVRGLRWIGNEAARTKLQTFVTGDAVSTIRVAASEALGALQATESETFLATALNDNDTAVRTAARKALEAIFPNDRTRVELLAVESRHADVAQKAVEFLASEGDPAAMVAKLGSLKNTSLRTRLRYGLIRRHAVPVHELTQLLEHNDPAVCEEAAWLLGSLTVSPGEVQRATLQNAITSAVHRAPTQWAAAPASKRTAYTRTWQRLLWAATQLGATSIVSAARETASSDAPPQVRRAAVRALEILGTHNEIQTLSHALMDPESSVRSAAASALVRHANAQAASLAHTVRPFDPVSFASTTHNSTNHASLLTSPEGRNMVFPSMLAAGQTQSLIEVANDTDAARDARLDVIAAMGVTGGHDAIEALTVLAFDEESDEDFRKAAYRALRRARRADERAQKEVQA